MKKILYQLAAAITFFTRLPLWKVLEIPSESFKKIICFWPLTGWITAGFTALAWLAFSMFLPPILAVILAFGCKVLLTGGLHEDGLGDFFDGFGGGRTKEDVLRIMKDSYVGSYALIGMIFYYLLLINTVVSIPTEMTAIAIFAADPFSKMLTALMMNMLPYARTEQVIVFIVVSILTMLGVRPIAVKYFNKDREKTNVDTTIGQVVKVTKMICNVENEGEVVLNGMPWTARSESGEIIEVGEMVTVKAVTGVKLIVEKNGGRENG